MLSSCWPFKYFALLGCQLEIFVVYLWHDKCQLCCMFSALLLLFVAWHAKEKLTTKSNCLCLLSLLVLSRCEVVNLDVVTFFHVSLRLLKHHSTFRMTCQSLGIHWATFGGFRKSKSVWPVHVVAQLCACSTSGWASLFAPGDFVFGMSTSQMFWRMHIHNWRYIAVIKILRKISCVHERVLSSGKLLGWFTADVHVTF